MEEDMMQSVQEKILPSVENLLPKIDTILGSLQTLIAHPALAQSLNHIEKTTSNLEVSTRQLNQMLSKDVPGIVNNLKTMTDNFSEVSANLKELDLATTVNSINARFEGESEKIRPFLCFLIMLKNHSIKDVI